MIRTLVGIRELAGKYDAAIVDLWGVIHDGYSPYPDVLDCLANMRESGMLLLFLSNAPRRAKRVIHRLSSMGIPRSSYDHLITSGDLARRALQYRADKWHAMLGWTYYHLGPPRDWGITSGLDYREKDSLAASSFILNTGLFNDEHEGVNDYKTFFNDALAAELPMVCVNPDLTVMRGRKRIPCAGTLAKAYERLGGSTHYHGKPHRQAYEACFEWLGIANRKRILAIGDNLYTDIAGAAAAGIESVLITDGIHGNEWGIGHGATQNVDHVTKHCLRTGHIPTAALNALRW